MESLQEDKILYFVEICVKIVILFFYVEKSEIIFINIIYKIFYYEKNFRHRTIKIDV